MNETFLCQFGIASSYCLIPAYSIVLLYINFFHIKATSSASRNRRSILLTVLMYYNLIHMTFMCLIGNLHWDIVIFPLALAEFMDEYPCGFQILK